MKVVEKFISINGEGARAGELAAFIRFKGCNMVCSYCDTAWANADDCPYEDMSPQEIADFVMDTGVANVTLTGGEPLLQQEMKKLLRLLLGEGHIRVWNPSHSFHSVRDDIASLQLRVEIETNGSVDLAPFCDIYRPVFTMDYKLPSSGCEGMMRTENFELLNKEDSVKFVCGSVNDLDRAREIIRQYDLTGKCNIYLSPVFGQIDPETMVEYMVGHGMNAVRLQVQLHKVIWHPERRGV